MIRPSAGLARVPLHVLIAGAVLLVAAFAAVLARAFALRGAAATGSSHSTDAIAWTPAVLTFTFLVTVFAIGVTVLLRATIRERVGRMRAMTVAIAHGELQGGIHDNASDDLGALSRAIDALAHRLQAMEGARHELLAGVSHELRTPLTIVRSAAFTLGRGERDPQRRSAYALIDAECERLAALIDDLMRAAALQVPGQRLEFRREPVSTLVADVLARMDSAARAAEVSLVVTDVDCSVVMCDRDALLQAVSNLVTNAIRHAGAGGHVQISASCAEGYTRIVVTDDGPPVPTELEPYLFEPFRQGAGSTGALGLGLTICRRIAELHGGTAYLDQTARGKAFVLSIPGKRSRVQVGSVDATSNAMPASAPAMA